MSDIADTEVAEAAPGPPKLRWRAHLVLFLATLVSVLVTGVFYQGDGQTFATFFTRHALSQGGQFAATMLTILVAHELGHYVAARLHKVDASLPYFIPLPILSPFGTMGAVIRMRGVIPTRRALLDIGASGPLAGLVFAIPLYAYGVAHSDVVAVAIDGKGGMQLGESILLKLLDHFFAPALAPAMDLRLSPIAFGAWGGLFVTMINLLPVGQLDGGHVAYALFGAKQDRTAQVVHRAMLAFFFVVIFGHVARDVSAGLGLHRLGHHLANSLFWLVWFQVLAILGLLGARGRGEEAKPGTFTIRMRLIALAGLIGLAWLAEDNATPMLPLAFFVGLALLVAMEVKGGVLRPNDILDHPATGPEPLDRTRAVVAVLTLVFFVLLFMPQPFSM